MPSEREPRDLLQRVLLLERQQGFHDRSAVGGLSGFARQQLDRADSASARLLSGAASALEGYAEKDRRGREVAVSAALGMLLRGVSSPGRPATEQDPVRDAQRASSGRDGPASVNAATGRRDGDTWPSAGAQLRGEQNAPAPRALPRGRRLSIVHKPEDLETPLETLKGMRKATAAALAQVGVVTVRDLLMYFPRTHYDYTDRQSISRMRMGQKTTLVGTIQDVRNNRTKRGIVITTATISDDTGTVAVRWFNQPYLPQRLPVGARIAITGEPEVFNGRWTFQPRDYEIIETAELTHAARLVPIYPLTKGLFQRSLRVLIRSVVEEYVNAVVDHLDPALVQRARLPDLSEAIRQYHFPDDEENRERAQQRLAFDELFLIQIGLLQRKQEWQCPTPGAAVRVDRTLLDQFRASLPFALTGAQERVVDEILADMSRPVPMSRLLQGDVGAGKTVVAAAALLQTVYGGKQGVLMAPTEILAEQHHRTIQSLLSGFDIRCELLIGSTPKARRREVYASAGDGTAHVLVGTHALIQEGVELADLGLAVTDEQHRFGVEQRAMLRQKGLHPHILAMTATPIPRTLAMTIYGDLDVSVLDEMPPGRLPPITTWCRVPQEAYGVIRDEVRKGRQAFVICPVIEESMESDMRSVIAEHRELQQLVFPDLRVGLLHGRMKAAQKEATLDAFRRADIDILVATSVVEVGIDVPNATVMVIRDAHRFGLAQLHQFRGRVGRGGEQAFCVLLSPGEGEEARERLEAVTATDNGFELAEEDLRLRGPGEFWGTRQSGLPELRVAQLGDLGTIQLARVVAEEVLTHDPTLSMPENRALRERVKAFWADSADLS